MSKEKSNADSGGVGLDEFVERLIGGIKVLGGSIKSKNEECISAKATITTLIDAMPEDVLEELKASGKIIETDFKSKEE